jgi:hypothetical protein
MEDISHVMQSVIKQVQKNEETVLLQVLEQILGRPAVLEDAKDLTKFYYIGEPLDYDLAYRGVKIGRVEFGPKFDINNSAPTSYTVTFKPPVFKSDIPQPQ